MKSLEFESLAHGRSKVGFEWSQQLVSYALDRFHRRHLRTPKLSEIRAGISDMPSHATIKRRYGNVSSMLEFHGYRVRSRGAQPGRRCSLDRDAAGRFLPTR
jgi:hypothetical protein